MEYKLSKNITKLFRATPFGLDKSKAEGLVVRLNRVGGDTFIKCGKRQRPSGVFTAGSYRRMRLLTGEKIEVTIPEGIITFGNAQVKAHDQRE